MLAFNSQTNYAPNSKIITVSFSSSRQRSSLCVGSSKSEIFLASASVDLLALMDQTTLAASLTIIGRALNASSQINWISGAYFVYVCLIGDKTRVLIPSANPEVKYVDVISASLWSPIGCLISQAGPISGLGRLVCGLTGSFACSHGITTHSLSCNRWGWRRRTHDHSPNDCERCCYFERTREVSGYSCMLLLLIKGL